MTIGVGVVPPVAGSRIVAGGGLVIPAHGLAEHVMLVLVLPGRPRASMTAACGGKNVKQNVVQHAAKIKARPTKYASVNKSGRRPARTTTPA